MIPEEQQKYIDEVEAPIKALRDQKWIVGANDRGMGHYSYAVITVDEEMIVKCDHLIIAQHIVEIHNKFQDEASNDTLPKTQAEVV